MIRRFSIDKMRRHMAVDTPDAVWKSFKKITMMDDNREYEEWKNQWVYMMRLKHGANLHDFSVFSSDLVDQDHVRVQLVATLYNPKAGRRLKKIVITPEMQRYFDAINSPNDIRRYLGMEER